MDHRGPVLQPQEADPTCHLQGKGFFATKANGTALTLLQGQGSERSGAALSGEEKKEGLMPARALAWMLSVISAEVD